MKNSFLFLSLLLLLSCSSEPKTDNTLLEKDKQYLAESMDSYKVLMYRFGKIAIRSSALEEAPNPEFASFKSKLENVNKKLMKGDSIDWSGLSAMDYIGIYRDYRSMKEYIEKTDEDDFPTLGQVMEKKEAAKEGRKVVLLSQAEKEYEQNLEHAFLSALVLFSRDLGKPIALYESHKTKPTGLPAGEEKALMQFFRGFLFFDKGLYYLSEDEVTQNINWLEANPKIPLPYAQQIFALGGAKGQGHLGLHAFNYLFRGIDRLMMKREIDEERGLKDLEVFLADSKQLGMDNEAIWAIESYLYLKQEQPEKAIAALSKLKSSGMLSANEKKVIDESINYLQDRASGKVLNGVYDNYFLSKVVSKYMVSLLAKVDWQQLLKNKNIPHAEEIFKTVHSFKEFMTKMDDYASGEQLKEVGKGLQETGTHFWEKAKEGLQQK